MPKTDTTPPVNQVGNPMPHVPAIETDDHATALLTWVFGYDPDLLKVMLGMFRCYRGMGSDPNTAFDQTAQAYARA